MNMKKYSKPLVALVLAILLAAAAVACDEVNPYPSSNSDSSLMSSNAGADTSRSSSDSNSPNSDSVSSSSSSSSSNFDLLTPAEIQKKMLDGMVAHFARNEDTVGWIYVPNTTINEVVVQAIGDSSNDYYMRRSNLKQENFNGCYFVDFRANMGERKELSKNTVIYGHSMDDNPDGKLFSQLKKYLNINHAKANPYIYFSTPKSEMVWQVFAVFYTDVSFNYIEPNPSNADFINIITDARKRSTFNFDVDVTSNDKILTLSTCTYTIDPNYPNDYRFVIMAKLLPAGTSPANGATVNVEVNPSIKAPVR